MKDAQTPRSIHSNGLFHNDTKFLASECTSWRVNWCTIGLQVLKQLFLNKNEKKKKHCALYIDNEEVVYIKFCPPVLWYWDRQKITKWKMSYFSLTSIPFTHFQMPLVPLSVRPIQVRRYNECRNCWSSKRHSAYSQFRYFSFFIVLPKRFSHTTYRLWTQINRDK